jgi:hypothetical protein
VLLQFDKFSYKIKILDVLDNITLNLD